MIRSATAITALLFGGLYAPLVLAAGGIPVVDLTDQPQGASSGSSLTSVANPVTSVGSSRSTGISNATVVSTQRTAVSANVELFMMVEQLQEELRFLRGQVEEQQHQLQRIQVDQRDRYRDLDRRLSLLGQRTTPTPVAAPSALPAALPSTLPRSSSVDATLATRVVVPAVKTPTVSDAQAYKDAFSLVRERNFDQALRAFESFLQLYPDSELTANVLYWTGEVHRAKPSPDQEKASLAYQALLTRYPDHPKAADAYYKQGLSYQEMGQFDKAKANMAKVIELFPNQAVANMAESFLKQHR